MILSKGLMNISVSEISEIFAYFLDVPGFTGLL